MNNMIIKIARLGRSYLWSGSEDTSYCGEYGHIKAILAKLSLKKGYVVDMAASDGVTYSCTLGFFKDSNWAGLAIEMDPSKFLTLAFIYSNFAHAQLARSR